MCMHIINRGVGFLHYFDYIINILRGIFDKYFIMTSIVVILFIFFVDVPKLKKKSLLKEAKIATTIAIIYTVALPVMYVLFKVL